MHQIPEEGHQRVRMEAWRVGGRAAGKAHRGGDEAQLLATKHEQRACETVPCEVHRRVTLDLEGLLMEDVSVRTSS